MAVSFSIEKRLNRHGEAPVRCSISIQGQRLQTTTKIAVRPEYWDSENQRILSSTAAGKIVVNSRQMSAKQMNAELKKIDIFFSEYENNLRLNGESVGNLKDIFSRKFGRKAKDAAEEMGTAKKEENAPGIKERLSEFLAEQKDKNSWRTATTKSMTSFKNHMNDFIDTHQVTSIDFFDEDGTTLFVDFLRDVKDLRNSTIEKYTSRLRYFLRWASDKGITEVKTLRYRPKLQQTEKEVIFLTWEELMKLNDFEFPELGTVLKLKDLHGKEYEKTVGLEKSNLERVRDVFCFCCFTSLRYSDVENLKKSNIFQDYIQITTVKTGDTLKIELNKFAKAILDKYRDSSFPENKALPVITNQQMNSHLKELGEICGFNSAILVTYYRGSERVDEVYAKYELLSTHAGRRTFIVNALSLGISPQVVMKWTGHKDWQAMKPYIDIVDKAKKDAMSLFDAK